MEHDRRFAGRMGEEYDLLKRAYPHYEEIQEKIGEVVAVYRPVSLQTEIEMLDIGCGDGATADIILASRENVKLIALDNEPKMVEQAHKNLEPWSGVRDFAIIETDALDFLRGAKDARFDIVASAFTLHNFLRSYREEVLREIFRVLKPEGLFLNADKYAPEGQKRYEALLVQLERFFDAFVPLGKYDLLKEWVLHNVADQAPDRVMRERDSVQTMERIGYTGINILCRNNMEAVVVARKGS